MDIFLTVTCVLLLTLTSVRTHSCRRELRARSEESARALATARAFAAQCEADRREYLAMAVRCRQRYEDLSHRQKGFHAEALARLQRRLPQPEVLRLHGTQQI